MSFVLTKVHTSTHFVFFFRILAALETVTESHQVQSAFRLLSQLCSLVLQRAPELVADLLTLSLPGIDSGDPFKTVQVLTFYVVLLGQMAAQDFSDVDVNSVPFEQISEVNTASLVRALSLSLLFF